MTGAGELEVCCLKIRLCYYFVALKLDYLDFVIDRGST